MKPLEPILLNPEGRGGLILICDHASNTIPEGYENLGLSEEELSEHIAWDIGMADISSKISALMDVPAVLGTISRLVIDCNRAPDDPTFIPTVSDGVRIPANQDLTQKNIEARKQLYFDPFHAVINGVVADHLNEGFSPLIIGLHSFTASMNDEDRPWGVGFLWNKDPRLAQAMIGLMERETDLKIGDNQPYSGQDLFYTMQRHAANHGLAHTVIEIRQDLIFSKGMVNQWAALLADCFGECLERADLNERKAS